MSARVGNRGCFVQQDGQATGNESIAIPIAIARRRKHGASNPLLPRHRWGNIAAIMLPHIVISIVPPSDGKAQGRWQVAGGPRRPDAEQSRQVTRCSCRHPATAMCKAGGRWSAASRRGTNTKSYQVAHAAPGGRVPPSDGKAQGRWSAASRRGTKSAGHSLLMPHPEVTSHPATAKRKAGGPRRPDAEQSRQVTRCSCRARRSRPTRAGARGLLLRPHPPLPNSQTDNDQPGCLTNSRSDARQGRARSARGAYWHT